MNEPALRVGTRGSLLARTQTDWVARAWAGAGPGRAYEQVVIRTAGDDPSTPLDRPGRPGVFVSALREALLAGRVDFIVHSMKDLPSAPAGGIALAAVPERADPRDVLVARSGEALAELPDGAVVGTSSPRRCAILGRLRPDLQVRPIRGNVDSRLAKLASGQYHAVMMAAAGLARIERLEPQMQLLDVELVVPAPAQGALAVECRADDPLVEEMAALDDPATRLAVTAERAVLAGVEAACTTAIAAHAKLTAGQLQVVAELHAHRGVTYRRVTRAQQLAPRQDGRGSRGPGLRSTGIGVAHAANLRLAERLGRDVAEQLLGS